MNAVGDYVATAPGKLVLLGDYVVLEGAPAVVAAMDRRAEARFVVHSEPVWHVRAPTLGVEARFVAGSDGLPLPERTMPSSLHFAWAVLRHVVAVPGVHLPFGTLTLQTDAFYLAGSKLGLGSSAAISCACWHVLQAAADAKDAPGVSPRRPAYRSLDTLQDLQVLHHTVQGSVGSGIDIAASLWGGVIRFQRQAQGAVPQVASLKPLNNLIIVPVWSGEAAATAPLLHAFAELKLRQPKIFWRSCETLAVLAQAGAEFWALGHVAAFLTVVDQAHEALVVLGERMGAAIVTCPHRAIAQVVRQAGGAYKPSGAGGGDLGIALCPTRQVARRVQSRLKAAGMLPVPMPLANTGATLDLRG